MNDIEESTPLRIFFRLWVYTFFSSVISGLSLAAYYAFKFNPYLLSIVLIIIFLIIMAIKAGWKGWGLIIRTFIGFTIINFFTVFLGLIKDSFWDAFWVLVAMFLIGGFFCWVYEKIIGDDGS